MKNFVGLYFKSPRGMTTGSSGMGEIAAKNSSMGPTFLVLFLYFSIFSLLSGLSLSPMKKTV